MGNLCAGGSKQAATLERPKQLLESSPLKAKNKSVSFSDPLNFVEPERPESKSNSPTKLPLATVPEEKATNPAGPASGHPVPEGEVAPVEQVVVSKLKAKAVRKLSHSSNSSNEPEDDQKNLA